MNDNKNAGNASVSVAVVPIDWDYKEERIIPDNGAAEQQIADEMDGIVYFD